jgi:hypothetical protein
VLARHGSGRERYPYLYNTYTNCFLFGSSFKPPPRGIAAALPARARLPARCAIEPIFDFVTVTWDALRKKPLLKATAVACSILGDW